MTEEDKKKQAAATAAATIVEETTTESPSPALQTPKPAEPKKRAFATIFESEDGDAKDETTNVAPDSPSESKPSTKRARLETDGSRRACQSRCKNLIFASCWVR